ncbi:hypothetical protein HT585_22265 [Ensifer sp. HO-A22]|uniref:Uncharacterized protein n=1 Tax=Ensifer oleiphilus TaxID=2742698 RepID=A0A7Y6UPL2_9HYPH|nr:hypothetical protein [Ensifer oleiphilus]NVD41596.1 hypothetical protein [Ensifer oleiphilus]
MTLHDFSFRHRSDAPDTHSCIGAFQGGHAEGGPGALRHLLVRIATVRRLREHHVWEAVRLLQDRPDLVPDDWPARRFRDLMAADALVDAVIHLTTATKAKLCLRTLSHECGVWTCTLRYAPEGPGRVTFKARHADLAAAILSAFLQCCRAYRLVIESQGARSSHLPT